MWVVEEMLRFHVNFDRCLIGIVPFGTGNDFSRNLGWSGSAPSPLIGDRLSALKKLVKRWNSAEYSEFDVWEVTVHAAQEGFFKKVASINNK